jgi:hypothetical protein
MPEEIMGKNLSMFNSNESHIKNVELILKEIIIEKNNKK